MPKKEDLVTNCLNWLEQHVMVDTTGFNNWMTSVLYVVCKKMGWHYDDNNVCAICDQIDDIPIEWFAEGWRLGMAEKICASGYLNDYRAVRIMHNTDAALLLQEYELIDAARQVAAQHSPGIDDPRIDTMVKINDSPQPPVRDRESL